MSRNSPGFVEVPLQALRGTDLLHPDEVRRVRFYAETSDGEERKTYVSIEGRHSYVFDLEHDATVVELSRRVVEARRELHALAHGWNGDPDSGDPLNPHGRRQ